MDDERKRCAVTSDLIDLRSGLYILYEIFTLLCQPRGLENRPLLLAGRQRIRKKILRITISRELQINTAQQLCAPESSGRWNMNRTLARLSELAGSPDCGER